MPVRGREDERALVGGPALHLALQVDGLDVSPESLPEGRRGLHAARFTVFADFEAVAPVAEGPLDRQEAAPPVDVSTSQRRRLAPA